MSSLASRVGRHARPPWCVCSILHMTHVGAVVITRSFLALSVDAVWIQRSEDGRTHLAQVDTARERHISLSPTSHGYIVPRGWIENEGALLNELARIGGHWQRSPREVVEDPNIPGGFGLRGLCAGWQGRG